MFALHIRLEDDVAERHEDWSKCLVQFLPFDRREQRILARTSNQNCGVRHVQAFASGVGNFKSTA